MYQFTYQQCNCYNKFSNNGLIINKPWTNWGAKQEDTRTEIEKELGRRHSIWARTVDQLKESTLTKHLLYHLSRCWYSCQTRISFLYFIKIFWRSQSFWFQKEIFLHTFSCLVAVKVCFHFYFCYVHYVDLYLSLRLFIAVFSNNK